jgi:hypothetical protein
MAAFNPRVSQTPSAVTMSIQFGQSATGFEDYLSAYWTTVD